MIEKKYSVGYIKSINPRMTNKHKFLHTKNELRKIYEDIRDAQGNGGKVFVCDCRTPELAKEICDTLNANEVPLSSHDKLVRSLQAMVLIYEDEDSLVYQGARQALIDCGVVPYSKV